MEDPTPVTCLDVAVWAEGSAAGSLKYLCCPDLPVPYDIWLPVANIYKVTKPPGSKYIGNWKMRVVFLLVIFLRIRSHGIHDHFFTTSWGNIFGTF